MRGISLAGYSDGERLFYPYGRLQSPVLPTRCLLQHHDPYQQREVLRIYQSEGDYPQLDIPKVFQIVSLYLYLPAAFVITAAFALLSWDPAHLL